MVYYCALFSNILYSLYTRYRYAMYSNKFYSNLFCSVLFYSFSPCVIQYEKAIQSYFNGGFLSILSG